MYSNRILVLQKHPFQLIYLTKYLACIISYFLSSKILPLSMLSYKSVAVLIYNVTNNIVAPNIIYLLLLNKFIPQRDALLSVVNIK